MKGLHNLHLEFKNNYIILFIDSKALNYDRNKCKIECTYNFKEMRFKLEYFEQKQYTLKNPFCVKSSFQSMQSTLSSKGIN